MNVPRFFIILTLTILSILPSVLTTKKNRVDLLFSNQLVNLDHRSITAMSIKPATGDALYFIYNNKQWSLKDSTMLLDQSQLRQLGGRIFSINSLRSVPADELSDIGKKRGSFELLTSSKKMQVDVYGETLLDQNSYIRIKGDPLCYVIEGNLSDILLTDITLLKRRSLFTIPAQEIREITITSKHKTISINQEKGVWKLRKPVLDWVDGQRVGQMMSAIAGAQATSFVTAKSKGLELLFTPEKADYSITLKSVRGVTEEAHIVFDKLSAKLYSMMPQNNDIIELDLLLINEIGASVSEFRSPFLFILNAKNFVSLDINWNGIKRRVERRENKMFVDNKEALAKLTVPFVNSVLGLKIKTYEDFSQLQLPLHYNTITLTTLEGELQIDFWKASTGGYWAKRKNEKNLFRIKESDFPSFEQDFYHEPETVRGP